MAKSKEQIEREKRRAQDLAELTPEDYYDPKPLFSEKADFNLIIGQRSNGKTFSVLKKCLEDYRDYGHKFVYCRRWVDDITVKNMVKLMDPLPVKSIFGSDSKILFGRGSFRLYRSEDSEPEDIGYAVALNQVAHTKSVPFVNVKNIILDEFLQLKTERILRDEFDAWEQTLSTIIRTHQDVQVWLLGNTVCKYSPYFIPYGVDISKLEQGDLKVILLPNEVGSPTKVAVEYCKYNPKIGNRTGKYVRGSKMARTGEWEIQDVANIPHCDNERAHECLVCSMFDHVMGLNLGIFLRKSVWYTFETKNYATVQVPHVREFLVIRQTTKKSSYYHLTHVKGLSYGVWTNVSKMFKDILENIDIDIMSELEHNRVYCEDMFTADYFYNTYINYASTGIRDLL